MGLYKRSVVALALHTVISPDYSSHAVGTVVLSRMSQIKSVLLGGVTDGPL